MKRYNRLYESASPSVKEDIGSMLKTKFPIFDNPKYFWSPEEITDFVFEEIPEESLELRQEDPKKLLTQFKDRETSSNVVEKYKNMILVGTDFDPVLVSGDEFIDGGHRVQAYAELDRPIPVLDIAPIWNYDWENLVKKEFGVK